MKTRCDYWCEKFRALGSELLGYPLKVSGPFVFRCVSCGAPQQYRGLHTFMFRATPHCETCKEKIVLAAKKEKVVSRIKAFVEAAGGSLISFTKGLGPVTLRCASCRTEFTYSTWNNLMKRNRECFCETCRSATKTLQDVKAFVTYFESEIIPLLASKQIQIQGRYPIDNEDSFLGFCSRCGVATEFAPVTDLLTRFRKNPDWKPLCRDCVSLKIGETQREVNQPVFLTKMRALFRKNGSKLLNEPQSTKDAFIFECVQCKAKSSRFRWDSFRNNSFLCPDCVRKNAGRKRRVPVYGGQPRAKRGDKIEYYNTWTRRIKKRYPTCVISGSPVVEAHHIYGFTEHPELAKIVLNGVSLSPSLHKEFHALYGRFNFSYFSFQDFYRARTGKEFYLYSDPSLVIDIVRDSANVLLAKKEWARKGVNYIPIWETELFSKPAIIESILHAKIGISSRSVFARNCDIVEVSSRDAIQFLTENHRQGSVKSKFRFGLKHPEHGLVAVMTFGTPRFDSKSSHELLRFCSKIGYKVPGAASRLFTHFLRKVSPTRVVSYCDVRFGSLDPSRTVYPKLGFRFVTRTQPGYVYVKEDSVISRVQAQKHKLSKILPKFDPEKTEVENMTAAGYRKRKDAGTLVFIYDRTQTGSQSSPVAAS